MFEHKSFLHSLKWAYLGALGDKAFSTLFYLILAGMLGPRDFGIVSLATIYVSFLTMFLDQGLATALIQKKDLQQKHLEAVFWMDLGLSICLVVVSVFFSRAWGYLNHSSEVAVVTSVLSVGIIFEALTVVQTAILKREMNFRSLSIRANVSNSISMVFGVVLAWKQAGVWALVGQVLLRDLIALILLWKLAAWRPSLSFSWIHFKGLWIHLKELMGFSINNFAAQLALFTDMQAGSIVIGMFFGPAEVGLYRIADKVVSTVITIAMSSIHTVSLSQFSRLQDHPIELKKSVLTCIRLSAGVTLPALAGLAAVSYPLMAVIGLNWVPAANALKVLCIMGMGAVFTYFTGPLMQALGRTHQIAALTWARTLIGCAILGGAGWLARSSSTETQILSIAGARLAVTVIFDIPFYIYFLLKLANISLNEFTNAAVPSVVASAIVAVCVHFLGASEWLSGVHPLPLLAIEATSGSLIGIGTLLLIDRRLRDFAAGVAKRLMRLDDGA
jgi:O-antigen/teichoic acid export membrane protein